MHSRFSKVLLLRLRGLKVLLNTSTSSDDNSNEPTDNDHRELKTTPITGFALAP